MNWSQRLQLLVLDKNQRGRIKLKLLGINSEDRETLFDDEDDAVRASLLGLIEPAASVKEFSQVSLQLQQLQKQMGDVQIQLQKQVGDVQIQLQKQVEDVGSIKEQVGDVQIQLQKQVGDVQIQLQKQVGDVQIQLQKQVEDVGSIKEQVGDIKEQVEVVMAQVDSNSSFLPSVTDVDKGTQVTKSIVRPILPKFLSAEEAEALWPEVCWKNPEKLSLEKYFQKLLSGIIDDASICWKIKLTGSSSSVSGPNLQPDVVIYKRTLIGPVPLTTGVILEIKSGGGRYDKPLRIGKAARYGEKMLEDLMGFRRSVLVGVTDLEKVLWFKVIRVKKERFKYERHAELNDVRGSLCALLKSSLSDLEVELPELSVDGNKYEPIRFLGSGATSNVFCVKGEDAREYAAKIPLYGRNLENDHDMLEHLNDVKGVPKTLGWFDDHKSLRIHPVGERISHKLISRCWSLVPGLVDVLKSAHKCGMINRDVRPDNIMIVEGESKSTDVLYILDWGFAVSKGKSYPFSGGVMYTSGRVLEQLASGDHHVMVDERDDTEALVHTIFALRYKLKNKMLRRMKREDYDGIRRFWRECYEEYEGWQPAWEAARLGDYVKLKIELKKMIP